MKTTHYCPPCGAALISDPPGTSLRCTHCAWRLISLAEWKQLSPFEQGFAHYMQASWPTSELKGAKNPYATHSLKWSAFQLGAERAMLGVQDGEE
jgi:DNA-directed RNA polymerase subunit RPC12/RpoP